MLSDDIPCSSTGIDLRLVHAAPSIESACSVALARVQQPKVGSAGRRWIVTIPPLEVCNVTGLRTCVVTPNPRRGGRLAARVTDIRIHRDLDVVPRSTGPLVAGSGACAVREAAGPRPGTGTGRGAGCARSTSRGRVGSLEPDDLIAAVNRQRRARNRETGHQEGFRCRAAEGRVRRRRNRPLAAPTEGTDPAAVGTVAVAARVRELTRREMIALLVDAGYPPAWRKGSAPAIPCSVGRPESVPADRQPNGHARRLGRSRRRDDSTGKDPARRRWPPFGVVRWPDRRAERANDEVIPVEMSRALTGVEYRELSGIGHFDIIDPRTPAYSARHGGRPRGHPR